MGEIFKREVPSQPLRATGERLTTEVRGANVVEHYHRYFLARELARGKRVLDIASGEGYGSAYLAQVATSVVGVDIAAEAVEHAAANYQRPNLSFRIGDALDIPLPEASVDLVVSFETLEHFYDQERFLNEVKRVLRPGGTLIISTPERDIYSPVGGHANAFHVRELTAPEFAELLSNHFAHTTMLLQRTINGSAMAPQGAAERTLPPLTIEPRGEGLFEASRGLARAMYLVAVASDEPVAVPSASFYIEQAYVLDREAELAAAQRERDDARHALGVAEPRLRELEAALHDMDHRAAAAEARVLEVQHDRNHAASVAEQRASHIADLERIVEESRGESAARAARVAELETALAASHEELHALRPRLADLEAQAAAARGDADARADRIAALEQEVEAARASAGDSESRVAALVRSVTDARAEAAAQASRAAEAETRLAQAGERLKTLLIQEATAHDRIAGLTTERTALAAELDQLRANIAAEAASHARRMQELEAQLAEAAERHRRVTASLSWRLTRPLRALAGQREDA
jgi:2-polyprenyl-3-methyl-5-hydroxy-6-metoxy-1,4-benzoquinol methylase/predicted  nucleic acid-binding Zn-ribbon protein